MIAPLARLERNSRHEVFFVDDVPDIAVFVAIVIGGAGNVGSGESVG